MRFKPHREILNLYYHRCWVSVRERERERESVFVCVYVCVCVCVWFLGGTTFPQLAAEIGDGKAVVRLVAAGALVNAGRFFFPPQNDEQDSVRKRESSALNRLGLRLDTSRLD
jgi:hypothetical protein